MTFDTIVATFHNGSTAEEIAEQFPTISLPDVYQGIGYYLRHSEELAPYFSAAAGVKRRSTTDL